MIKVAIIGSGGIAKAHVKSLMKIEEAKIISTQDVIQQRAEELASICGATAYTDQLSAIKNADLVYVLTPPSFHKDIAISAMKEGKDVVIEKPVAISIEDAEQIAEAAYKWNKKAMVGFNMRYRTGYKKLKEIMESQKIGKALNFWSQRMGMGGGNNWRTNPKQLSGFTIESLSHDIDMFRWLSESEVVSVSGDVKNSRNDLPGYDDNALVILRLKNGSSASIQASWSSHLEFNNRGIVGLDGTAMISGYGTWDFDTFRYRTKEMQEEYSESFHDPLDLQSYYEENLHFVHCVKNNQNPTVTIDDGITILKISHAILKSHRQNKVIEI